MLIILDLVKSAVTGQNADQLIKVLINVYKILHLFTRDVCSFSFRDYHQFNKKKFQIKNETNE
jgi:hypothetical protein